MVHGRHVHVDMGGVLYLVYKVDVPVKAELFLIGMALVKENFGFQVFDADLEPLGLLYQHPDLGRVIEVKEL